MGKQPWAARFATAAVAIPTLLFGFYLEATAAPLCSLVILGASYEFHFVIISGCRARIEVGGDVEMALIQSALRHHLFLKKLSFWI